MLSSFLNAQKSAYIVLQVEDEAYSIIDINTKASECFGDIKQLNLSDFLKQHLADKNLVASTLTKFKQQHETLQLELKTNCDSGQFQLEFQWFYEGQSQFVSIKFLPLQHIAQQPGNVSFKIFELSQKVANIGSWYLFVEFKQLICTTNFKRILEVKKDYKPVYGDKYKFIPSQKDRQKLKQHIKKAINHGKAFEFITQITTQLNHKKWVKIKAEVELENNKIVGLIGTLQDITAEKEQELQLKKRNHFISTVLDNLPIGVAINEIDSGKPTYFNEAFQNIYGHDKAAITSFDEFFELVYPEAEYREKIKSEVIKDIKSGDPSRMAWQNLKVTTAKGETRYISAKNIPLFEQNIMISTVTNETQTYLANQELKHVKDRFLYASKAVSDAIWDFDVINDTRYWGNSYQQIFNVKLKSNIVDEAFWRKHIHNQDLERVMSSFFEALNNPKKERWSCHYRFKNGENTYADVFDNAVIIRDKNAKAIRVIGALKDISKEKARTDHLNLLESVIENTTDAILVSEAKPLDQSGPVIIYANKSFKQLTGYDINEIIGRTPKLLHGQKTSAETIKLMYDKMLNYESFEVDVLNYNKKGQEYWVNLSVSPIANSEGKFTHWVSVEKDITEKKSKEIQQELIKETNELFKTSSHLAEALNHTFKLTQKFTDFNYGELWVYNQQEKKLKQQCYIEDNKHYNSEFSVKLTNEDFSKLFISQYWHTNSIKTIKGISSTQVFTITKNECLITVFYIPIIQNSEKIGLLILGYNKFTKREDFLTELLEDYRVYLGSEIKHKQAEDELNQIVNYAPDFICIARKDGYLKRVNPSASKILGYTNAFLMSNPIVKFFHPEDYQELIEKLKNTTYNTPIYLESRVLSKSNSYIHIAWTISRSKTTDLFYCVGKDITDKIKTELELKNTKNKFELISKSTNDVIWEVNLVEDAIDWSEGFGRHFGYKAEDYPKTINQWIKLIHKDDLERVEKHFDHCIKNPKLNYWTDNYQLKDNNNSFRSIYDQGYIMRDQNGKALKVVGALQDITNQKNYEAQLEKLNLTLKNRNEDLNRSNKELEQFAYVASHDLQEPLRMISGFLSQLDKNYDHLLDEKAKQYIYFAVDGAQRMRKIILDLLEFSKVDSLKNKLEEVKVATIIEEAKMLLKASIESSKASIKYHNLPTLVSSKYQLRQIFVILIDNAIKYVPKNQSPNIEISSKVRKHQIIFSVKDNAIIINNEQYKNVFAIFTRLKQAPEVKGTGIGLATAKKIVTRLGGRIWVESHANGNLFKFSIPLNNSE
ncbi:MAG: PAS domain-containing protein [Psychroflexus salarius]